ncbi:poly(3-hydroxybutyrate) depolymerase [Candidatus Methylobacter oryzae]|uniref:Poly(3-hydroxybutyrate) depolymerase n=1 Tax=Candidatus Methylobacter oryzae TaxID=2497749 RepID=A0ABY3CDY2_9GAMM|nr:poly(3-hydroxybutyrate) depolymerase [Candidatus Methylobacter oryzae]TRX01014.1 poly(3-hydroxybutyrate) depolymerase [Candidatus Methylobacter oryzae]
MFKAYSDKLKMTPAIRNNAFKLLFLLPILITLIVFFSENSDEYSQVGSTSYAGQNENPQCVAATFEGESGAINGESTLEGIKYNIRTPLNYKATIAHPLLVVFSPAGSNRAKTEKTTALTLKATTAGFIVAYADHPELSPTSTIELGTIPSLIAKQWCIDKERIFLTGHSDGGTAAMALAFMSGTKHIPKAIAPSAAGINSQDLRDHKCPDPIPVMIMHSVNDHLFPKYGQQTSGWWAACNQCEPIPEKIANGCMAYTGCAKGVKTWYCEGDKLHAQWPGINDTLLDFLISTGR